MFISSGDKFSLFIVYLSISIRKHFLRQQSFLLFYALHQASSELWFLFVCSSMTWGETRTRLKIINLLRSIEKHICSFFSLLSNFSLAPFRLFHFHVCCSSYSHPLNNKLQARRFVYLTFAPRKKFSWNYFPFTRLSYKRLRILS